MIPDYVIVTIQTEAGTFLGDFQLPTAVSIGKIGAVLGEHLSECSGWTETELCWRGFPLETDRTLADHGIWDGSIITVREGTR